jgi:uncharacterized protein Yka (UPF0111/DUF47 family)
MPFMAEKQKILDALGESQLVVPALVNRALAANDRAKYYFSLLQMAAAHAARPEAGRPDLRRERIAAGEEDPALDNLVAAAHRLEGEERVTLPGAAALFGQVRGALEEMIAPLRAAQDPGATEFEARYRKLSAEPWCDEAEHMNDAAIRRATSASREAGDSLHLLVMDLHKALNRLQAGLATETVDGARAYGLAAEDRPRVAAFARGVRRTSPLKFDHPGLETTAARAAGKLVLQNDIGTTDAHVLVVHVEGLAATLTYTDVHLPKLVFFQGLLSRWPIAWNDTRSRNDSAFEDGAYHVAVGTYRAPDAASLEQYLEHLGSRLVFLIDWNRARKRLRRLLRKKDSLALLRWAADEEVGHMAFLKIGGEQLVFEALASLGKTPAGFGARLDDVLGGKAALNYLKFVFRAAAEALREGRPEALLADEIRAELLGSLLSVRQTVLDYASEQAGLAAEIASAVRDALLGGGASRGSIAERAKDWEKRADELVNLARELGRRSANIAELAGIVERGDDTVDALEDAAFHLSLMPPGRAGQQALAPLAELAELALHAAQEYLKAVEGARDLGRGTPRAEVQEFLQSVHRIVELEQRSDEAERAVHTVLAREGEEARHVFVIAEVAKGLETASDALMHSALALRDHMLGSVMAQ